MRAVDDVGRVCECGGVGGVDGGDEEESESAEEEDTEGDESMTWWMDVCGGGCVARVGIGMLCGVS